MAKLKINSKRLRVLRTRSPYGRRLKFEKQESRNEMSSSLLDKTSRINEQEELIMTSDKTQGQTETNNEYTNTTEELNLSDVSSLSNEQTQGATSNIDDPTNLQTRELPLSESSVVEDSKVTVAIKEQVCSPKELPLSKSSVVEEPNINNAQASTEKQLQLSESSVVEEKRKSSSIKKVGFIRS